MSENVLSVDLFFDQRMDQGFCSILENKMKMFDLKGIAKAIKDKEVDPDFHLKDKTIEENFKRYIRYLLNNISDGVTDISIKFPEELKMEIYFS